MKLLLINPAERQVLRSNLPLSIERFRGKNPPIGLLYAAAAAQNIDGWSVELIDAHAEDLGDRDLAEKIKRASPDLTGITAATFTYLDVLRTAEIARGACPSSKIILGGVHPFLYPAETLRQKNVDIILSGEAERSLPTALKLWAGKGFDALRSQRIPGLFLKGHNDEEFAPAPPIEDLDSTPLPAWELSPLRLYRSLITPLHPVTIMITSRGCPFRCRYCALSVTGKKWRAHSAARVVEEMKVCRSLGIRYILFYDEIFTLKEDRVFDICDRIRKEEINLPWMARGTAETVNEKMFRAMRDAGCETVTFGVESGSERVLENLGRKHSVEKMIEAGRAARKTGLQTIAYFMIGSPGETDRDIEQSRKLAGRLNPDMIHAAIFMPYPGSAIYQDALSDGSIREDYWQSFAEDPKPDFAPPYWNREFSDRELEKRLFAFYRRFSFRPAYILGRLRKIRSLSDLLTAIKGAATMLLRPSGK